MKINCIFILVSLMLFASAIHAQNFDADSIYYTPIPKAAESAAKKPFPRKIFLDTIQNDKLIQYFFNVQAGPLIGCNDCSQGKEVTFTSSTVHGITIGKKFRTGIGVGFDSYYSWQTLPLFGSVSWDLLGTKNTQALFVQFNYGWSKPWRKKTEWEYGFAGIDGGRMANAQIGYRIKYHDLKISLAIGSKRQQVYTYFEFPTFIYLEDGTMVPGTPSTTTVKQDMKRLMFSLAIGWK